MICVRNHNEIDMTFYNCPDCNKDFDVTLDAFGRPERVGQPICRFCGRRMEDVLSLMRNDHYRVLWHLGIDDQMCFGPRGFKQCCV